MDEITDKLNKRAAFGVLNQFTSYYNGMVYVVSNLLGRRLRVNRLTDRGIQDTGDFETISNIEFDYPYIGKYKQTLCEGTRWLVYSMENTLYRIDYTKENQSGVANPNASGDQDGRVVNLSNKPQSISYLKYSKFGDSEKFFAISYLQSNDVGIYKLFDFGAEVKMVKFPLSIKFVVALQGINNKDKSAAENLQYQLECVFVSFAWDLYVRDCLDQSINKRSYTKVNGFYSIESLETVVGSNYVYTGSQNEIALWDITSTDPIPVTQKFLSNRGVVLDTAILPPRSSGQNNHVRMVASLSLLPIFIDVVRAPMPSLVAKNLCLVEGCVQCPGVDSYCEVCWPGFIRTEAGDYCVDCGRDTRDFANRMCANVRRPFSVVQTSRNLGVGFVSGGQGQTVDLTKSGLVLRIIIAQFTPWQWRLMTGSTGQVELDGGVMRNKIRSTFGFSIEDVDSRSYLSSYVIYREQIYLALNFTTDFNNKKLSLTLRDTLLAEPHFGSTGLANNIDNLGNQIRRTSMLVLINNTVVIEVSGRETIDEAFLRSLGTAGKIAGTALAAVAVFTSALALLSICTPFGAGSFLLSFFQVIEIVSRFRLINVRFGLILTQILEGLNDSLELPGIPEGFFFGARSDVVYSQINPETRGKLSYYEESPISLITVPILSFMYILVWMLYLIYRRKLIKTKQIRSNHVINMMKLLTLRFFVYGMGILDFALYCVHEIVHHKALFRFTDYKPVKEIVTRLLGIDSQEGGGSEEFKGENKFLLVGFLSFVMSIVVLVLSIIETIKMVRFAKKIYFAEDLDFRSISEALGIGGNLFGIEENEDFGFDQDSTGIEKSILEVLELVVPSRNSGSDNLSSENNRSSGGSKKGSSGSRNGSIRHVCILFYFYSMFY